MRRFLTLVCLLCLTIPAGITISGCTRNPGENYCNGLGYGMKVTDVDTISLQPATTGISIAFGQTRQASTPTALTCKGASANAGTYTYGTTNNQLVDISPAGNICAGTWNRNSGGGIADYTKCYAPSPLPSTGGLPYSIAYITASAQSVTSNPVEVYVHAAVASVSLVTTPSSGSAQQCYSQNSTATLDAQACYANSSNQQVLLCAPASVTSNFACPLPAGVTSVPNCTASIGALTYAVSNSSVASTATNTTTNQVTITALQPGTTAITASVANSGSSAGYFSTCPPASISLTLANNTTSGTITQGVTQNLTHIAYDTNVDLCPPTSTNPTGGCLLTGLSLTYQSTDPIDISVSSGGAITTSFPGVASVYAICQPPNCNAAPINEIGVYGTGLPVSSNPVTITTPGTASDYVWFAAPGQSQYIVPVELLNGTLGATMRLPYVPNSMVMDRDGNSIYFGSSHALMTVSTSGNSIGTPNTAVPGVVLAVSPNNSQLLINDQVRQIFYLYNISGGSATTFGGMGTAAAWTPDSDTLYIVDSAAQNSTPANIAAGITGHTDALYVYNASTGWISSLLACSSSDPVEQKKPYCDPSLGKTPSNGAQSVAITIPSVGAFFSGSSTMAHTWCPSGTVGNYASMSFYPQGPSPDNTVAAQTDVLAATTDGNHILGASTTGSSIALSDIGLTIPALNCLPPVSDPNYPLLLGDILSPLVLQTTLTQPPAITATAATINQVVPSPTSTLAFITYTPPTTGAATGVKLPFYVPGICVPGTGSAPPTCQPGTVGSVPFKGSLASSITAPLTGAFTPDNKLFFVSTAGDNMIHYISIPLVTTNPASADTQQISPNLPACTSIANGGTDLGCVYSGPSPATAIVPATGIAIKPRSTT
jgi:sugar lactone lactonase YvrE